MSYRATDGSTVQIQCEFVDEESSSFVVPAAGYPKVRVYRGPSVLVSTLGVPSATPGTWNASIALPELGIEDSEELTIKWVMRDGDDNKYSARDILTITPARDTRLSDILVLNTKDRFDVVLPIRFDATDVLTFQAFNANVPHWSAEQSVPGPQTAYAARLTDKTVVTVLNSNPVFDAQLASQLLQFTHTRLGANPEYINFMLWVVTPQIQLGMSHLEAFLNKSRIENTIPELQWTPGDLVTYLERGLYLFNTIHTVTSFTGTNMQGSLFDAWVSCSCYYALGAQLLGEGSLSFDFSGQGISLNVDRTPALESALGRIESMIDQRVVPLKKQLGSQGIITGDGSIGLTNLRNAQSLGRLGLGNAATTRLPLNSGIFVGSRVR